MTDERIQEIVAMVIDKTIEAEEAGSDAKRLNRIMEDAPADIVRDSTGVKEFLFKDITTMADAYVTAVSIGFKTVCCITVPEIM